MAVIGAGPSGLVALKELRERGHAAVAFDAGPSLGGLYASSTDDFELTTSNLITSFGAFPAPGPPTHWTRREYLRYLEAYADRFGLASRIHLGVRVASARREPESGGWQLETVRADGRSRERSSFDALAVCTGQNRRPVWPKLPGHESFRGRILHAAGYRSPEVFAGRRVLLVGLGESGSDLALAAARKAEAVAVSTRRGPGFVIPRRFAGAPSDLDTSRCYHAIPWRVAQHPVTRAKTRIEALYLAGDRERRVQALASEWNRRRRRAPCRRFATKTAAFCEAVLDHGVQIRPDVEAVEGGSARFADGSSFDCDVIVCCTGYRSDLRFLAAHHPELAARGEEPRALHHRMIDPAVGPSLAWIGFVRPAVGAVPPCAELQARYLALLLAGERRLPDPASMRAHAARQARLDFEQFPDDAERLSALTDYLRFLEDLATAIGCRPDLGTLLRRDRRTLGKLLFGPLEGAQYRLRGPGADPETARRWLREVPTMPRPVLAWEAACLLGAEGLHRLGLGEAYRPIGV